MSTPLLMPFKILVLSFADISVTAYNIVAHAL
jgi:hypothetical protein